MAEKSTSGKWFLLIIPVTIIIIIIVYFVLKHPSDKTCDDIFQQTTVDINTKLTLLKQQGDLTIGEKNLQDLTSAAQIVALNLKACCVMNKDNAEEFLRCKEGTDKYKATLDDINNNAKDAKQAQINGDSAKAEEKMVAISKLVFQAKSISGQHGPTAATGTTDPKALAKVNYSAEPIKFESEYSHEFITLLITGAKIEQSGDKWNLAFQFKCKIDSKWGLGFRNENFRLVMGDDQIAPVNTFMTTANGTQIDGGFEGYTTGSVTTTFQVTQNANISSIKVFANDRNNNWVVQGEFPVSLAK